MRICHCLCSKNVLRRLYYDYYFHRQEDLWRRNALKTLPVLLNSSDMMACGEDLGLIPACVHPVSLRLILSHTINPREFLEGFKEIFNAGYARTGISWPTDPAYAKWTRLRIWHSFSIQLHDGKILLDNFEGVSACLHDCIYGITVRKYGAGVKFSVRIFRIMLYMPLKNLLVSLSLILSHSSLVSPFFSGMCSVMPWLLHIACLVGRRWGAKTTLFQGGSGNWHGTPKWMCARTCPFHHQATCRSSINVGYLPSPGTVSSGMIPMASLARLSEIYSCALYIRFYVFMKKIIVNYSGYAARIYLHWKKSIQLALQQRKQSTIPQTRNTTGDTVSQDLNSKSLYCLQFYSLTWVLIFNLNAVQVSTWHLNLWWRITNSRPRLRIL